MAELRIPIIGEFKGKKAFGDAEKATGKLDKGVKKLAGTLAAAFSVQKIVQFGKEAVKAFAENEKSAKRLETVVKNLGLAFETPGIEASLDKISAKFGLEGEVLREAFQKLITTTGSAKKSQDLLNLSLDVAAGSTVDLLTVNQDLAAAFVGQTRGLRKYNLGLSQSELKTLKFDDAVALLTKTFKGAAEQELDTYAGKMRVLGEAADNAQEIIGKSLVESLSLLAGDNNTIEPLATAMADFATYIGDAIYGIAVLSEKIKGIPGFGGIANTASFRKLLSVAPGGGLLSALDALAKLGSEARPTPGMGGYPSSALGGTYIDPNEAARKKAEAEAAKRAKELAALQKKTLDMQKKANALTKAAKTIDLDRISMTAALRGKISETDRLSLNLQLALLDKNEAQANKLSAELEAAVKRQNALNAALLATPKAPNPYEDWKIPKLDPIVGPVPPQNVTPVSPSSPLAPKVVVPDFTPHPYSVAPAPGGVGGALGLEDLRGRSGAINVTVVLNDQEVGNAIRDVSVNDSLSGSFNTVNRTGRFGLSGTQ
jgi:hypothetical protein